MSSINEYVDSEVFPRLGFVPSTGGMHESSHRDHPLQGIIPCYDAGWGQILGFYERRLG